VNDVILCGHTDCGVMNGVLRPDALRPLEAVSNWLKFAQPAKDAAEKEHALGSGEEFLLLMTEKNVLHQLENLKTHPSVAHRLEKGDLRLHGWVYHIGEGKLTEYSARTRKFAPLSLAEAGV